MHVWKLQLCFFITQEEKGAKGGIGKHWQKPLNTLICSHLILSFFFFFKLFLKKISLWSITINSLHCYTKWETRVQPCHSNPCGRALKLTSFQFTSVWTRNKTRGWCIFINYCQWLLACTQTHYSAFAECVHQSKMLLEAEVLTSVRSRGTERFGRPAWNLLPIVIFIALRTAIINNASCSSTFTLKLQIAIKSLNFRQWVFDLIV